MQSAFQQRTAGQQQRAAAPARPHLQPVSILRVRPFAAAHSHEAACSTSYCVELHSRHQPQRQRRARWAVLSRCQAQEQPSAATSQHPFPEEADFDLLSNKIHDLTQELKDELRGCNIYLTGMMGSGKSTVGKMLANTLKYAFFDTDVMVEMAHDKTPVANIFKEFGEAYFRDAEAEVIRQLAPYKNLVISTGGGAVLRPMNWSYMHTGIVVWLHGPTSLLAQRVAKDGLAKRPLLAGDGVTDMSEDKLFETAKTKLDSLLEQRSQYYENADLKISLEGYGLDAENGAPTVVIMYRLLCALKKKIEDTKTERENRRHFTIEHAGDVPTMRTQQSPASDQDSNSSNSSS